MIEMVLRWDQRWLHWHLSLQDSKSVQHKQYLKYLLMEV